MVSDEIILMRKKLKEDQDNIKYKLKVKSKEAQKKIKNTPENDIDLIIELMSFLKKDYKNKDSIFVFNESIDKDVNQELGQVGTFFASFLGQFIILGIMYGILYSIGIIDIIKTFVPEGWGIVFWAIPAGLIFGFAVKEANKHEGLL